MATQARIAGFGSFVGIDLNALPVVLEAWGVPKSRWRIVIEQLVEISSIAARYWNEPPDKKS